MSTELFSDFVDLNGIEVKEALEDGSFSYTDGNSPSAELKLVVRGAFEAYPAYMAVVNYLQRTYGDEDGYVSMCNIPLSTINLSKMACDYAYTAECSFQFEEDTNGNGNDGSANNRESNRRGTSPNNPIINNNGFQMPEIQASDFQYANTGGTMHLTHAYSQRSYYLYPETNAAEDYNNGIGQNSDGDYEGVDIVCPSEVFSVTVSAPYYWLNSYYRALITGCTGCTNEYPFWGYAPECVLFKGISASPVALNYTDMNGNAVKSWYWRIRYEFEARRGIVIPNLNGDFSWMTRNEIDDTKKIGERKTALINSIMSEGAFSENEAKSLVAEAQDKKRFSYGDYLDFITENEGSEDDDWPTYNTQEERARYDKIVGMVNECAALDDEEEIIKVGDGIYKPGFRYIWFSRPQKVVGNSATIISNYLQANVAQVYPTFDFNRLNLPQISDAD